jgi:hypothetical protein
MSDEKQGVLAVDRSNLYAGIREVLSTSRQQARQAVNEAMVQAYWQIGRLIVEDEQQGEARAEYGKNVCCLCRGPAAGGGVRQGFLG